MKEPWYKAYAYHAGCEDILSEFANEKEFENTIPINHRLNVNKITLYESCIWLKYERMFGGYPSIQQIRLVRNKSKSYTMQDLIPEDNYAEHF